MVLLMWWRVRPRRKPGPTVGWVPDDRPEAVRLESYADEKLREMGLAPDVGSRLRAEVDQAMPAAAPDYAAEIAAIERWARTRRRP